MPILTAVVVKPKESAMRYHEWVEFSPFEIGMAKYATFMKPNHFGSQLGCPYLKYDIFINLRSKFPESQDPGRVCDMQYVTNSM